ASRFYKKYEQTLEGTSRAFAAEIPMMPRLGDWEKFKEKTGIDIDIDFNQRPPGDALSAIERLERIEKETSERLSVGGSSDLNYPPVTKFGCAVTIMNDFDLWKAEVIAPTKHVGGDAATLFDDILSSNDEASLHD
ncbi:uncharacterized protein LOC113229736, partial [Hyposmocoma kahamanoa]|uniref:uncharacterized protein LOC113229736 n=1 Tax=Hyposmocoma kahamanoa TaxID=1477025 RepID=UPI000E6D6105